MTIGYGSPSAYVPGLNPTRRRGPEGNFAQERADKLNILTAIGNLWLETKVSTGKSIKLEG